MEKVSNLTYNEIVQFYHTQVGRVELTWFRIMYLHAAVSGILVFFFEAETFLVQQRALVLAVYTVNLLVLHFALKEGYAALRSAVADLKRFPESDGHVDQWFRAISFDYKANIRSAFLVSIWILVAYLLFWNVL